MVFESKIISQREIASGTHEVTFERPPSPFVFEAGQYMQVAISKLTKSDVKGPSRIFSIASSPGEFETLSVVFRISDSGFKETLRGMSAGSIVTLEQASGSFLLPQTLTRPQVFIAGGVGIAPFMSYLLQNAQVEWRHPISLVYGNQSTESTAYLHELKQMAVQQRQFSFEEVYELPTTELFVRLSTNHPGAVWWVVGPPRMVDLAVGGLQAGGISSEDIRTESFDGY